MDRHELEKWLTDSLDGRLWAEEFIQRVTEKRFASRVFDDYVETLREEVSEGDFDAGHEAGYDDGYEEGWNAAADEVGNDQFEEGYKDGYEDGVRGEPSAY